MVFPRSVAFCALGALITLGCGFPYLPEKSSSKVVLAALIALWSTIYALTWRDAIRQSEGGWRHTLVVIVFVVSMTVGITIWLDLTLRGSLINNDFTQDYLAGHALRQGKSIYGPALDALSMRLFKFESKNFHPPFNALLFVPLTSLPYRQAFAIWNVISLVGFGVLVVYSLHACALSKYPWLPLSALLLLWTPFTGTVWLGQISLVLALLVVFGFVCLVRQREVLAGVLLGCATLIKLFPGFLLLYVVVQRRWRCAASLVATVAVGLLLTLSAVGIENSIYYIEHIVPEQMRLFASYPFNTSIESVARTLFGPNEYYAPAQELSPITVGALVWLINGSLIVAACLIGWRCRGQGAKEDLFGLFCITMLLVSPITWKHSCLMLVFPMARLLRDGLLHERLGDLRVLFVVLILFAVPDPAVQRSLDNAYAPGDPPWYLLFAAKTGAFGLLLLWVTFWVRGRRQLTTGEVTAGRR